MTVFWSLTPLSISPLSLWFLCGTLLFEYHLQPLTFVYCLIKCFGISHLPLAETNYANGSICLYLGTGIIAIPFDSNPNEFIFGRFRWFFSATIQIDQFLPLNSITVTERLKNRRSHSLHLPPPTSHGIERLFKMNFANNE